MFDTLAALSAPKAAELRDELARYLSTDPEHTEDVLLWWTERKSTFPRLSRMALDYLSIPGKSSCICPIKRANIIHQLRQQTLSVCLAKDGFFSRMFAIGSHRNQSEL